LILSQKIAQQEHQDVYGGVDIPVPQSAFTITVFAVSGPMGDRWSMSPSSEEKLVQTLQEPSPSRHSWNTTRFEANVVVAVNMDIRKCEHNWFETITRSFCLYIAMAHPAFCQSSDAAIPFLHYFITTTTSSS
jgi:hypothetical protein